MQTLNKFRKQHNQPDVRSEVLTAVVMKYLLGYIIMPSDENQPTFRRTYASIFRVEE
jgi:hypothetical protein